MATKLRLWTNQKIVLYHGTLSVHAASIMATGVKVGLGKPNRDFGIGFYTTTVERQAESWAALLAKQSPPATAAIVEFRVDRDLLAALEVISFVRGDYDAEVFWSLVSYCRNGGAHHARRGPSAAYDVATGPVAAFWQQRSAMSGADQVSFHTTAAEAVLNGSPKRTWNV